MKLVWLMRLLPLCSSRAGGEGKNNNQTPHGLYKGTMCRPRGLFYLGIVADSLHNQKQPRGATHSPMAMRSHRPPGCYLVSNTTVPTQAKEGL